MNSNLFHNIANVVMIVLAAASAALLATGCTTLADGTLECSKSFISPAYAAYAIMAIGVLKVVVNIARDGFAGLTKVQPPVTK